MENTILIVDNDPNLAEEFAGDFQSWGYDAKFALRIDQAQHLLKSNDFEVVLMDMWLNESPMDFVQAIKSKNPKTKIILFSGSDYPTLNFFRNKWGADGCVEKGRPDSAEAVDALIQSWR